MIESPITAESLEIIYEWFEDEEVSLANAEADGETVDREYFNDICKAVDELFSGETESPDLDYLNDILK